MEWGGGVMYHTSVEETENTKATFSSFVLLVLHDEKNKPVANQVTQSGYDTKVRLRIILFSY